MCIQDCPGGGGGQGIFRVFHLLPLSSTAPLHCSPPPSPIVLMVMLNYCVNRISLSGNTIRQIVRQGEVLTTMWRKHIKTHDIEKGTR